MYRRIDANRRIPDAQLKNAIFHHAHWSSIELSYAIPFPAKKGSTLLRVVPLSDKPFAIELATSAF